MIENVILGSSPEVLPVFRYHVVHRFYFIAVVWISRVIHIPETEFLSWGPNDYLWYIFVWHFGRCILQSNCLLNQTWTKVLDERTILTSWIKSKILSFNENHKKLKFYYVGCQFPSSIDSTPFVKFWMDFVHRSTQRCSALWIEPNAKKRSP